MPTVSELMGRAAPGPRYRCRDCGDTGLLPTEQTRRTGGPASGAELLADPWAWYLPCTCAAGDWHRAEMEKDEKGEAA